MVIGLGRQMVIGLGRQIQMLKGKPKYLDSLKEKLKGFVMEKHLDSSKEKLMMRAIPKDWHLARLKDSRKVRRLGKHW